MAINPPIYNRLRRLAAEALLAQRAELEEEIAALEEELANSATVGFYFYGSGRDAWEANGLFFLEGPLQHTTITVTDSFLVVGFGWEQYMDISATESITIVNSTLCSTGDSGDSGSDLSAGSGGESGGGASRGLDGAQGAVSNGSAADMSSLVNMSNPDDGHRGDGGNGGGGDSTVGGIGGFDDGNFYYPPFSVLLQGGISPKYPISVGGHVEVAVETE